MCFRCLSRGPFDPVHGPHLSIRFFLTPVLTASWDRLAPSPPRRPLVSSPSSSSRRSLPPTPPHPDRLLPSPFSRPSPPNPKAVSLPPPPRSPSPRGVLRGSFGRGGVGDGVPSLSRAVRPQRRRVRRRCRGGTHGREEGKAIVMAGSGLSLLSGSGNVLPFVLASPSSSQKIPHCWLHR